MKDQTPHISVDTVRAERFFLVDFELTPRLRKELDDGVELGQLGHKKKNGMEPEIYYHPNFENLAYYEIKKYIGRAKED